MTIPDKKTINLPSWIKKEIKIEKRYSTSADKARLVIELSRMNVLRSSGGPFGAAVFDLSDDTLISIGVNLVVSGCCSVYHAEIVAIMLAEEKLRSFNLRRDKLPGYLLFSSAQPCAMCFGAILWSGIAALQFSATREDVEKYTDFDEGPLPLDWKKELKKRNIKLLKPVIRKEAIETFKLFQEMNGVKY
jgi:tRNA(Arg) A34 adenosine deaminase TadA